MVARLCHTRAAHVAGVFAVLLFLMLLLSGCGDSGLATTPGSDAAAGEQFTTPAQVTAAPPTAGTVSTAAGPGATSVPVTQEAVVSVDDIEAEYVYTSELITILYPLYGSKLDDFVTITLTNNGSDAARILVKSEVVGYTDPAMDTVEVPAGEALEVGQNPLLISSVIDDLNTEKPAPVHVLVQALQEGEERTILDETGQTIVFARRDFPHTISGFTYEEDIQFYAAMVTPNDPAVEALLREAADYTDSGIMWAGYGNQPDDGDGGVWDRLQAIWQAENDYDLTYVNTWVSFAPGSVQRIRLPAEVLDQRGGNCIELALLYASAAEAIDLEAAIILIPGHAFVGIRTDQENANYYFIETTMIGGSTFSDAVTFAGEEFEDALPHLDAGDESYGWVKVWDARDAGILPLPWH